MSSFQSFFGSSSKPFWCQQGTGKRKASAVGAIDGLAAIFHAPFRRFLEVVCSLCCLDIFMIDFWHLRHGRLSRAVWNKKRQVGGSWFYWYFTDSGLVCSSNCVRICFWFRGSIFCCFLMEFQKQKKRAETILFGEISLGRKGVTRRGSGGNYEQTLFEIDENQRLLKHCLSLFQAYRSDFFLNFFLRLCFWKGSKNLWNGNHKMFGASNCIT